MSNKKVYLASDHAGFELKEALTPFLIERGYEVEDLGASTLDPQDDYTDYCLQLGRAVAENKGSFGIGIGGSGQGEAMAANRIKGARAVVYYGPSGHAQTDSDGKTLDLLTSTRQHNNANILSLGARFMSIDDAKDVVIKWLMTDFGGEERHIRRLQKLDI